MNRSDGVVIFVTFVVLCAVAFVSGIEFGQQHPPTGKVLAPAVRGHAADLPPWACKRILQLEDDKLLLFEQMVKAYEGGEPPTVIHFREPEKIEDCR